MKSWGKKLSHFWFYSSGYKTELMYLTTKHKSLKMKNIVTIIMHFKKKKWLFAFNYDKYKLNIYGRMFIYVHMYSNFYITCATRDVIHFAVSSVISLFDNSNHSVIFISISFHPLGIENNQK